METTNIFENHIYLYVCILKYVKVDHTLRDIFICIGYHVLNYSLYYHNFFVYGRLLL